MVAEQVALQAETNAVVELKCASADATNSKEVSASTRTNSEEKANSDERQDESGPRSSDVHGEEEFSGGDGEEARDCASSVNMISTSDSMSLQSNPHHKKSSSSSSSKSSPGQQHRNKHSSKTSKKATATNGGTNARHPYPKMRGRGPFPGSMGRQPGGAGPYCNAPPPYAYPNQQGPYGGPPPPHYMQATAGHPSIHHPHHRPHTGHIQHQGPPLPPYANVVNAGPGGYGHAGMQGANGRAPTGHGGHQGNYHAGASMANQHGHSAQHFGGHVGNSSYGIPGPYGAPQQHPGMHHSYQQTGANMASVSATVTSDSASIASTKSSKERNKKERKNATKKRTIEGIHHHENGLQQQTYPFRRTESNTSSASTVTAGNNTAVSAEASHISEASPSKRERSSEHHPHHSLVNVNSNSFDGNDGSQNPFHQRNFSATSSASSLSVGGLSFNSYDGPRVGAVEDSMITSKRHKRNDKAPLVVDTGMRPPSSISHSVLDTEQQSKRFEELSIEQKQPQSTSSSSTNGDGNDRNLFLSLSTSPINHDVDATPISKNTAKAQRAAAEASEQPLVEISANKYNKNNEDDPAEQPKLEAVSSDVNRSMNRTPTPPVHGEMGEMGDSEDKNALNQELRRYSFTAPPQNSSNSPTPAQDNNSPSHAAFSSAINSQLSWSIAGDTPSLGDLAEWENEDSQSSKQKGTEQKNRPSSTSSAETRGMMISPHDFEMWKEEHELADNAANGATTPLPVFFDETHPVKANKVESDHIHQMFVNGRTSNQNVHGNHSLKDSNKQQPTNMPPIWSKHDPPSIGMPPTPLFTQSELHEGFGRGGSPMDAGRRESFDFFPSYPHPGNHPGGPNDRIRNLRGRCPPNANFPPMPIHIPPPMSSHLPMTSPMGLGPGKAGLWSPHHGVMGPPMGSPHHLSSPLGNMAQSKRKCVPLKPPIPSKFQGDIEKMKSEPVPEFTSLVNFPAHMSQKQSVNLPDGMRCCVMCGSACPCSSGNKGKKNGGTKKADGNMPPRTANGQDARMGDKSSGYAIIPTQNKGLCTLCDVNVWVVVQNGLEIKWCKGCKNFRPWAAFGDKGLATKCLRCRERQREKYALQKEEKEKARLISNKLKK